jgi:hypothetical protein
MKMAPLRTHNAGVALRQRDKTGVTIALSKTLLRTPATVDAMNVTEMFD